MLLNIKNVLNVPGTALPVDLTVSDERLETVHQVHGFTFAAPVTVKGQIENRAGVTALQLHISCSLLVTCERCLKETVQDFAYDEEHIIVRRFESEEEEFELENYIVAKAESIDPEEIAVTDLILELPSKMLCKEDCKGLCPVCGCDRNETDCGHTS
ncbi:MAG: DUF177 domain-containing protein [Oscillospiraceae bacterium]|nr:DUF177 domain-containing protein [Oscillospiraceae bacterium]